MAAVAAAVVVKEQAVEQMMLVEVVMEFVEVMAWV